MLASVQKLSSRLSGASGSNGNLLRQGSIGCEGAQFEAIGQMMERLTLGDTACSSNCQKMQFSTSSSSRLATGETATEASNINPLLQAPNPDGGNQGDERGPSISSYGPGRAGAKLKNFPMSQKKVNHFASLIRRMHVDDALAQCKLHPKKAGDICHKVIRSAIANAEFNHGLDPAKLKIDIINVGRGSNIQRRSWIHGRGRTGVRTSYKSHLEIVLKEDSKKPGQRFLSPILERRRKHFTSSEPSGLDAFQLPERQ